MNKKNDRPTAKLIFTGERLVSLPKVADILSRAIDPNGALMMEDVTLTSLILRDENLSVLLDLGFEGDETILSISVESDVDDPSRQLAALTYALASRVPVNAVLWPGNGVRIPRESFVDGLADMFARPEATISMIAPKRVRRSAAPACTERPIPAAPLPANSQDRIRNYAASKGGVRGSDRRFDAHVVAYEENLRESLRICDGIPFKKKIGQKAPVEARLATWALSISAATISLPVAIPVMAYNLIKGEDIRAAALSMGVAGFILAIDQSGLMAAAL